MSKSRNPKIVCMEQRTQKLLRVGTKSGGTEVLCCMLYVVSQLRPPRQGRGMNSSLLNHIPILVRPAASWFCGGRIPAELTSRLLTRETDDFPEQTVTALFEWDEKGA